MSTLRNPQQDRNGGAESQSSMPFGSFKGITKTMQAQFAAAVAVPQAMLEANLTMGSELFGFIGRRMKAQAELCNELSQCREVTEAVEAHRKFSERVTSDYSSEIGQLATIMSKELAIVTAVATEVVGEADKAGKLAA
jgi:hypothetical protein